MKELLDAFFKKNDFLYVSSQQEEVYMYFRYELQGINVVQIIDYKDGLYYPADSLQDVIASVPAMFEKLNPADVHIVCIVICRDEAKARHLIRDMNNCWILEPDTRRLIVDDDAIQEFYGIRGALESILADREASEALLKEASKESIPQKIEEKKRTRSVLLQRGETKVPWVTFTLAGLNVLLFLICTFTGDLLYNIGDLNWFSVLKEHEFYRLLTSMFLHADIDHLMGNMLVFVAVNELIESYVGHGRTLLYYFLSGIGGGTASMLYSMSQGEMIRSVGASGAIFGMTGVLMILFLINRDRDNPRRQQNIFFRLLFMIIYMLYSGFTSENTDNAAHVGGLLTGLVLALILELIFKRKKGRT